MKLHLGFIKAVSAVMTVGLLVFAFQNCSEVDFAMEKTKGKNGAAGFTDGPTDEITIEDDQPNPTPTPEDDPSPTPSPSPDPSPSPSPNPTASPDPSPSPNPTASPGPSPSPNPTASPDPSPSPNPTASPDPSPSPNPTASPDPSPSPSPTASPTATPEPTPEPKPGCGCADTTGAKIYLQVKQVEIDKGKGKDKSTVVVQGGSMELSTVNAFVNDAMDGEAGVTQVRLVLGNSSYIKCGGEMHNLDTPGAMSSGLKVNQGNAVDHALGAMGIHIDVGGVKVNLHETGSGKCKLHPHISVEIGDQQTDLN